MTRFSFALGALLLFAACDATGPDTATTDLSEAEAAEAAAIVAEALADDAGGLMASTRDMTAGVSASGLTDTPRLLGADAGDGSRVWPRPCRAAFSVTYAADTGTHRVGYRCGFENATVQKGYAVAARYRFRDAAGAFVPRPWDDFDSVDSVAFDGSRQGFVKRFRGDSLRSESEFEQTGRWALSQLADDATPAVLAGSQTRAGRHVRYRADGIASRAFSVELSSSEILIRESDEGLGYSATGEVAYVLTMEVVRGDRIETRTVEGTAQLDGNGRALLRVLGLRTVYRVSLISGETDGAEV